jgi:hypothetical protein
MKLPIILELRKPMGLKKRHEHASRDLLGLETGGGAKCAGHRVQGLSVQEILRPSRN